MFFNTSSMEAGKGVESHFQRNCKDLGKILIVSENVILAILITLARLPALIFILKHICCPRNYYVSWLIYSRNIAHFLSDVSRVRSVALWCILSWATSLCFQLISSMSSVAEHCLLPYSGTLFWLVQTPERNWRWIVWI